MRPVAVYSALRLGLFLAALLILRVLGVGGILSLVIALLMSMLLSFVILRRQRDAVTRALMARKEAARTTEATTGRKATRTTDGTADGATTGPAAGTTAGTAASSPAGTPRPARSRWSFGARLAEDAAVEDAAVDRATRPTDGPAGGPR